MKVVLVPVADRPECMVALQSAFELSAALGASVIGCHVRPGRSEPAAHGPLIADGGYPWSEDDADGGLDSEAARALFERIAGERGFRLARGPRPGQSALAVWHAMVGSPALIMQIVGPMSDLVVLSRPKARASGRGRGFLLAGLLHSGRPALVLPQVPPATLGERVVIAWDQGPDVAAAVHAALPLIRLARKVVVVTAGPERRAGPRSTALVRYLKYWGVSAERVTTRGRRPDVEVEQAFRRAAGDLLVMGAYSRPRLRELIFGGMTERMLFETEIPTLLYHH